MTSLKSHLQTSREALDLLIASETLAGKVEQAIDLIVASLSAGHPLLVCGNGGSASDAMHIAGELVGRFLRERRAINCIDLTSNATVITAWANDCSFDAVFARQVEAFGAGGGVLLGISTSGNSANVVEAFETARRLGLGTVALTGEGGGKLAALADVLIDVPSRSTPIIQQLHVTVYHHMCERIESAMM